MSDFWRIQKYGSLNGSWSSRKNRKIARNSDESYNTALATNGNAVSSGIGQSTKLQAFGADYALSKRTSVYMRYETITDDALLYNMVGSASGSGYTAGQGNGKITNTAFGIRATF